MVKDAMKSVHRQTNVVAVDTPPQTMHEQRYSTCVCVCVCVCGVCRCERRTGIVKKPVQVNVDASCAMAAFSSAWFAQPRRAVPEKHHQQQQQAEVHVQRLFAECSHDDKRDEITDSTLERGID